MKQCAAIENKAGLSLRELCEFVDEIRAQHYPLGQYHIPTVRVTFSGKIRRIAVEYDPSIVDESHA